MQSVGSSACPGSRLDVSLFNKSTNLFISSLLRLYISTPSEDSRSDEN
jgi:hypothetical protein